MTLCKGNMGVFCTVFSMFLQVWNYFTVKKLATHSQHNFKSSAVGSMDRWGGKANIAKC